MKKPLFLMALLVLPRLLYPQSQTPPPSLLSLHLMPGIDVPVGESSSLFGLGGELFLGMEYRLPPLPLVFLSGGIGYGYSSLAGVTQTVSVTSVSVGAGARLDPLPWLSVKLGISGGYYFGFLNDLSVSSGNPFISAGAGVTLLPGPLQVEVGAAYRSLFGLYSGISASVGVSYALSAPGAGSATIRQGAPVKPSPLDAREQGASLELKDLSFDSLYPVFHKYYDDHPFGEASLRNSGNDRVTDIKVSFIIRQFMDAPKDCPSPTELNPGQAAPVSFVAILKPNILETTEATKVQAEIGIEYKRNGELTRQVLTQTVRVMDRNAMTWDDDRRAAAFVTAKDPEILMFSKNVTSMVKGRISPAVNANLVTAMAVHEALRLYGLSYVMDPSGYSTARLKTEDADFLQFPRQTLEYKAGDCDDLSILYCALLESVGIETAFITVPGHIFMAFSTATSADDARTAFSRPDELIFSGSTAWVPVEITDREGFLLAWREGAKEWRENAERNQARIYPLHDAWGVYEPVGLPGAGTGVSLPPAVQVVDRLRDESGRFVEQEISPRVEALQALIRKAPDARKNMNELGVLYARYGLYDQAQREFEKIVAKDEYCPALLNLGNIFFLADQKEKALDLYNRAYAKDPTNPRILLAVAKAGHELENYYLVKKAYGELKTRDPDLAQRFSYLEQRGVEATRAAETAGVRGVVLWED